MRATGLDEFPIVLSSFVQAPIGAIATPNADDLQNDFERDIQIEEIRFLLSVNGSQGNVASAGMGALGALVRAQIRMGRLDLTNGYVPVWLLGTRMQQAVELATGFFSGTRIAVWEYHRWKLPKPLVVPAGSTVMATFQYLTPTGRAVVWDPLNSPISVNVAMVGRSLPRDFERPALLKVPYASAWIPSLNNYTPGFTLVSEQTSGNDVLHNKFNKPFYVQRFIGRAARSIGANTDVPPGNYPAMPADSEIWAETGLAHALSISSSDGYAPVRDMAAWTDVFEPARCALEAGVTLPPLGWYTVRLAGQPPFAPVGAPGAGSIANGYFMPMISMVGWREEELIL